MTVMDIDKMTVAERLLVMESLGLPDKAQQKKGAKI